MVPLGLSDGPNTHPNIDTNPRIYRTVYMITLTEEYGRYRRSIGLHSPRIAVDRGSRIKYLWFIIDDTCCAFLGVVNPLTRWLSGRRPACNHVEWGIATCRVFVSECT